ncbi:hypothetical protein D1007_33748 [Hordeum vulgare]|nr:hypothetical protein D1007_33748 [Hordeum vulgare]
MEDGRAAAVRMMHHRLVATGKSHEPLSSFRHHFDRLPRSYLHTRCVGSPEDVLLDQRLLADAKAKKRLVAHARLVHRVQVHYDDDGGGDPPAAQPRLPELRYKHYHPTCSPKLTEMTSGLASHATWNTLSS